MCRFRFMDSKAKQFIFLHVLFSKKNGTLFICVEKITNVLFLYKQLVTIKYLRFILDIVCLINYYLVINLYNLRDCIPKMYY